METHLYGVDTSFAWLKHDFCVLSSAMSMSKEKSFTRSMTIKRNKKILRNEHINQPLGSPTSRNNSKNGVQAEAKRVQILRIQRAGVRPPQNQSSPNCRKI